MILWVIKKFQEKDNLLAKYQEKYQYVMVDEYQDTNGAQNALLFQLVSYWENQIFLLLAMMTKVFIAFKAPI
ncbi:MAG: UvrD-helicase domain-containing protein [Saprospiraceae bacterium]|nr:UvrD-helicase domain-containing protein [Saprospiraceae bacterium]